MSLNSGHKSAIVRLWNLHMRIPPIAKSLGMNDAVIEGFLETRAGYPGKIVKNSDSAIAPKRDARRDGPVWGRHGPEPKITLPRVRFLEDDNGN